MKVHLLLFTLINVFSCKEKTNIVVSSDHFTPAVRDTVIVKHKNELNESYEVGFRSKSYFYYWIAGKDTLDLRIYATEHKNDSSLNLHLMHKEPMLFSTALRRMNDCIKLIEDDFYVARLASLYFKSPIYFTDFSKEVAKEYEQEFGKRNISYSRLNKFLLKTNVNAQLNSFLKPLNKAVAHYGIEKFQLLHKENYRFRLEGIDTSDYPDFVIDGMGLSVRLEEKK